MSWLITGLNCSVESCQRIPDRPAIRLHLLPGESGGRGRRRQAAQPGPNLEMIIMQTKQQKSNVGRLAIAQAGVESICQDAASSLLELDPEACGFSHSILLQTSH